MSHKNSSTQSRVLSRIQHLLESGLLSDVTFLVGGNEKQSPERIAAHKCILGSASPVFERMFTGDFKEGRKEVNNELVIEVPDVTPSGFREFLRWVYTHKVTLSLENVGPLLYSAKKYDLSTLVDKCTSFMENIPYKDLCPLFYQCKLYGVIHLVPWLKGRIVCNSSLTLSSDSVLRIEDYTVLMDILSQQQLNLDEIDIFRTALHWASSKTKDKKGDLREILGPALYSIRFPLLSPNEFVNEVIPSGLLNDEEILDILKYISKCQSSVSTGFSILGRERCFYIFESITNQCLNSLSYSIGFSVDCPVQIYGYGVYIPSKEGLYASGSMRLEKVDPIPKEEEKCLFSGKFYVEYAKNYTTTRIDFDESIVIDAKTLYRVYLEYDKSSIDVDCWCGEGGRKERTVDGVRFEFEDCSDRHDIDTTAQKGQIPHIYFTRLPST